MVENGRKFPVRRKLCQDHRISGDCAGLFLGLVNLGPGLSDMVTGRCQSNFASPQMLSTSRIDRLRFMALLCNAMVRCLGFFAQCALGTHTSG